MLPESQSLPVNSAAVSCSKERKQSVHGDSLFQLLSMDPPAASIMPSMSTRDNLAQRSHAVRLDIQSLVPSLNMSTTINNMRTASSNTTTDEEVCELFGGLSIASFLETCSQLSSEFDDEDDDDRSVDSLQFYRRTGRLNSSPVEIGSSSGGETTITTIAQ